MSAAQHTIMYGCVRVIRYSPCCAFGASNPHERDAPNPERETPGYEPFERRGANPGEQG